MAKTLDVYRDWLGVQETTRPLNFYQVLRLKRFEDNTAKIREHFRKITAHLRKYDTGETAARAHELHAELSKALLCLTDSRRKQEYDASLGRTGETQSKQRGLEEILTAQNAITPEQLSKAQKFAQAAGLELRDALIQIKAASADVVMSAYAESVGVPYVDVADIELDESLVSQVPAVLARQNSCAPMMVDGDQLLMVSPHLIDPNVEEELRLRLGMPVRSVLCTPAGMNELINKHYPREKAAAEVAAGGTKQSTKADGKSGSQPTVGGSPAKAVPKVDKSTPEYKKQRRDYTIVTGNFTFMAYEVFYTSSGFFPDWSWLGVFAGFFVAGGAAYYTWSKMA